MRELSLRGLASAGIRAASGLTVGLLVLAGSPTPGESGQNSSASDGLPPRTQVYGPGGIPLPEDAYPGVLPVVEQRFVTDRGAQEPDLDFASDGSALYFSWETTDTGFPPTDVYRILDYDNRIMKSADDGRSWADVTPARMRDVGGGDPVVYRDPLSDRVFVLYYYFFTDLHWTDDGGETWFAAPPIAGLLGVTDYPRLWSVPARDTPTVGEYPSILFLCYYTGVGQECRRSLDGGLTWGFVAPPFGPTPTLNFRCGRTLGRMAGSATDQTLYMPFMLQAEAPTTEGYAACSSDADSPTSAWGPFEVWVSVSRDLGASWDLHRVAPWDSDGDRYWASSAHMRLAADTAGNAYLLFLDATSLPHLSISRDHGATWSDPISVAAPDVTAANVTSLVAGDEGRIAFFYVGTTLPGGYAATEQAMAEATWHGYTTFSLNALDGDPVFAVTLTAEPTDPLRRGPCQLRCNPDPNDRFTGMYDYTNLKVDPATGAVWVAFVDLCDGACAQPGATSDAGWVNKGAVGVQTAGTPLRGG